MKYYCRKSSAYFFVLSRIQFGILAKRIISIPNVFENLRGAKFWGDCISSSGCLHKTSVKRTYSRTRFTCIIPMHVVSPYASYKRRQPESLQCTAANKSMTFLFVKYKNSWSFIDVPNKEINLVLCCDISNSHVSIAII